MFLLFVLLVTCNIAHSSKEDYQFFPNLPSGKYNLKFNAISNCNPNREDNKINFNWYLSKKSFNSTEMKGNVTMKIPIDDSLTLNFKMAVKDSIGGWKDNAYIFNSPKACSTLKSFMGKSWKSFMENFGRNDLNCPLKPGNYTLLSGYDTSYFQEINVPKIFFYGTYKYRFYYSDKTDNYGCVLVVVEVKRPWEEF